MDDSLKSAEHLCNLLRERSLSEVLVVRGDTPQDMNRKIHPTSSSELIRVLKEVAPEIQVYAAFDPYRTSLSAELESVHEKIEAGAGGLFSQALFGLRFMELCADQLPGVEIYWSVAPVTTASSRRYWEAKNHVFFPSSFEPTIEWNRHFAKECLSLARESDQSLYFMPIGVALDSYLEGLLQAARRLTWACSRFGYGVVPLTFGSVWHSTWALRSATVAGQAAEAQIVRQRERGLRRFRIRSTAFRRRSRQPSFSGVRLRVCWLARRYSR